MPNYTPTYGLIKPLESEFYDVGVQNGNMDVIDQALRGLVTWNDLLAATVQQDITIPVSAWVKDEGTAGDYKYHADVEDPNISASYRPSVTLYEDSEETAKACGLRPSTETLDGALRVWARSVPTRDIRANLTLFCAIAGSTGGAVIPGGGNYTLPAATATQLGGVKVGDGLTVAEDGTLSVNQEQVMTDADLVNEEEVAQDVANILNGDIAK